MAHIIFLIKTRHYQELNKFGTTAFGSTNQEICIFNLHTNLGKMIKENKIGKP
jgi:hypothetical protein